MSEVTGSDPAGEELITIARIARPQGVRGEVIAELLTDFPERFARPGTIRVVRPDGEMRSLQLERGRLHQGRIVLKFAGYDRIEEAEELRAARVVIERRETAKLPENNWYEFELVDCVVITITGTEIGRVIRVENYGAAPLLVVSGEQREYLIPLALGICREIDPARKRIVIDPPEGLLELQE
jgi:16S rRNA processing protein RimM